MGKLQSQWRAAAFAWGPRSSLRFAQISRCVVRGDLVNFISLGEGRTSSMVAEWEFRRQAGGMDDDKKEPKHEHDNS